MRGIVKSAERNLLHHKPMAGSGSYYEEYMRSNALAKHGHEKSAKKLLTDRNAYISFLEVQLERVSAACLTTQSFEKRIAELETAQTASDQKVGSLSSVFRLHQEYIEQTAEQSRSDVAGLDGKWDSWMEKYGQGMHSQQRRMDAMEEQLRQCEDFLQRFADQIQGEMKDIKVGTEQELEDLKTLVFTLETRFEGMQCSTLDTDKHLEFLKDLVTDRFDKVRGEDIGGAFLREMFELEIVRASVSDKCFTMESKLKRLSETLEQLPNQLETSWKADLIRLRNSQDEHSSELQETISCIREQHVQECTEMKAVMRKCLDTQHLLSSTVVAIQSEVDEQKQASPDHLYAIDDLRENQLRLKDALRMLQTCTQNAQQENQENCGNLADRLQAAEHTFMRLTEDSLVKADDLRTKMLVALGEVEQKLRHDADMVAEQAVRSVRVESECQFKQMVEFTSTMENRLRILERSVLSIESDVTLQAQATVQRSRIIADVLDEAESGDDRPSAFFATPTSQNTLHPAAESGRTAPTDYKKLMEDMEEKMRSVVLNLRHDIHQQESRETILQEKILQLEDRLRQKAQSEEEQAALFPRKSGTATSMHPNPSLAPNSGSSSSCTRHRQISKAKHGETDNSSKRKPKADSTVKKHAHVPFTDREALDAEKVDQRNENCSTVRICDA